MKNYKCFSALFSTLLLAVGCAFNGEGTDQAVNSGKNALHAEVEERTTVPKIAICKRVERTGSRIKRKICHTEKEWETIERQSVEQLEKMKSSGDMRRSANMNPD